MTNWKTISCQSCDHSWDIYNYQSLKMKNVEWISCPECDHKWKLFYKKKEYTCTNKLCKATVDEHPKYRQGCSECSKYICRTCRFIRKTQEDESEDESSSGSDDEEYYLCDECYRNKNSDDIICDVCHCVGEYYDITCDKCDKCDKYICRTCSRKTSYKVLCRKCYDKKVRTCDGCNKMIYKGKKCTDFEDGWDELLDKSCQEIKEVHGRFCDDCVYKCTCYHSFSDELYMCKNHVYKRDGDKMCYSGALNYDKGEGYDWQGISDYS